MTCTMYVYIEFLFFFFDIFVYTISSVKRWMLVVFLYLDKLSNYNLG